MTQEEGEKVLQDKGYTKIIYWKDEPHFVNKEHSHPEDVGILVLSGEIEVSTFGITDKYKAGDFYELPANIEHHSVIGADGCSYLVGKK